MRDPDLALLARLPMAPVLSRPVSPDSVPPAESAGAGQASGFSRLSRGGSAGAPGSPAPGSPAPAEHDRDPVSVLGPLRLERTHKRVMLDGHEMELTPTEYRLLSAFMVRPGGVLSRRELAQLVWGYEDASIGRSIDVHVHRLRTKLQHAQEANGRPAPSVISARGFGYKLLGDAAAAAAA